MHFFSENCKVSFIQKGRSNYDKNQEGRRKECTCVTAPERRRGDTVAVLGGPRCRRHGETSDSHPIQVRLFKGGFISCINNSTTSKEQEPCSANHWHALHV